MAKKLRSLYGPKFKLLISLIKELRLNSLSDLCSQFKGKFIGAGYDSRDFSEIVFRASKEAILSLAD
jgi:hypothetical protein